MTVVSPFVSYLLLSIVPLIQADVYVYDNANKLIEEYDDQPANFGPSFPSDGLKGYVTLTSPKNACHPVASPPTDQYPGIKWIALIPRAKMDDVCDFDLKVLNAQNANFSAVIIYNYEDSLISMGPHGRDIQIPSTLISHSDGVSIIAAYLFNRTRNSTALFYVKIDDEQLFKFGAYVIPFVVTIGISFLALVVFMLIKCCLHRRHARRHRLPRSALKQLRTKKFVKGDRWDVCAICLDDYEEGAKLRILPCDHAYHMKCIDPWLLNNRRQCPVCKRYVFLDHENSDAEENNSETVTERTPLLQPADELPVAVLPRDRPHERQFMPSSNAGVSNMTFNTNESSDTDDAASASSSRPRRTNNITTDALVFDQSSILSHSYPGAQVQHVLSSTSNFDESDRINATVYGSAMTTSSTSFLASRAANFFVGSLGNTTEHTNISARSPMEGVSDADTDHEDERMHSVLTDVELNHAYVSDEDTSNGPRTML